MKKIARVRTSIHKKNLKKINYGITVFDPDHFGDKVITEPISEAVNTFYFLMNKAGIDTTTVHVTFTIHK